MKRYICYWPAEDAIDNCGFLQDVDDFLKYSDDGTGEDLRRYTAELPTTRDGIVDVPNGAIILEVECPNGGGFSYRELRAAADRVAKTARA